MSSYYYITLNSFLIKYIMTGLWRILINGLFQQSIVKYCHHQTDIQTITRNSSCEVLKDARTITLHN